MAFPTFGKPTSITIALALSMAVTLITSYAQAAGYRLFKTDDLRVHVWYPTDSTPVSGRLGPFDVKQAMDAPLRAGRYEIVLISHGFNGRPRNHHLTAQALADAGFVVIVPTHAADFYIDTDRRAAALDWRVTEFRHALELVMRNDEFRPALDTSKIHGIGYSLDTATMMMASGAGFNLSHVDAHCETQSDPAFCKPLGLVSRWLLRRARGIHVHKPERDVPSRHFSMPLITGRIALVAPIAQGLIVEEASFAATKVFVLGFSRDKTNVAKFHTSPYRQLIPLSKLDRYVLNESGSHVAFIAPFAKRVTDIEHIEAAIDPPGFDRRAFLDDLNAELVTFFSAE